jgi:hypothetical protein
MVDGERIHRVIGRESDGTTREQAERAIERLGPKPATGASTSPEAASAIEASPRAPTNI